MTRVNFALSAALVAALVLTVLLRSADPASAAPGKGAAFQTFEILCEGEVVTVTSAASDWAAAHVVGENGDPLVPYGFDVTIHDLDTGETFNFSQIKPGERAGTTLTCTIHEEVTDPESGHALVIDIEYLLIRH